MTPIAERDIHGIIIYYNCSKEPYERKSFEELRQAYTLIAENSTLPYDIVAPFEVIPSELGLDGNELTKLPIGRRLFRQRRVEYLELTVGNKTAIAPRKTAFQPGPLGVSTDRESFIHLIFPFKDWEDLTYDRGLVWLDISNPLNPMMVLRILPNHQASVNELVKGHLEAHGVITQKLKDLLQSFGMPAREE